MGARAEDFVVGDDGELLFGEAEAVRDVADRDRQPRRGGRAGGECRRPAQRQAARFEEVAQAFRPAPPGADQQHPPAVVMPVSQPCDQIAEGAIMRRMVGAQLAIPLDRHPEDRKILVQPIDLQGGQIKVGIAPQPCLEFLRPR